MPTPETVAHDEFLSVLGAAKRRRTTPYRVLIAIALGDLRTGRVGGKVVVRADDVERWTPSGADALTAA